MECKKYELTSNEVRFQGHTLYRIRALIDFGTVKAGDLGGWIEKEENLSHEGLCWVNDEARVYDDAQILDNAQILENAQVFEHAKVRGGALIYGRAWVYGNAIICGSSEICGEAYVSGNTLLNYDADQPITPSLMPFTEAQNYILDRISAVTREIPYTMTSNDIRNALDELVDVIRESRNFIEDWDRYISFVEKYIWD